MSLRIVHYNDRVLRKKGERVTVFDHALKDLVREMIATMHEAGGIGLAAQQIGHPLQLCVVDLRDAESPFTWMINGARPPLELFMPMVLVNPVITPTPGVPATTGEEGCLSFPGIRGPVPRQEGLTVKFEDENGIPHTLECDGLLARCILHEADHLNGVLFVDHLDKTARASVEEAIKALARETQAAAEA